MTLPTVTVSVSFATAPMSTPEWVDISSFVREWSTERGRSSEMDRQEAGSATLVLDNRDRRFDPTYTAGPYYGNIWPMRKLKIEATYNGVTYDVFHGFIESWLPSWPQVGKDSIVNVEAVDGFKWLSLAKLNTSYVEEAADVRINNVLDSVSWTAGGNWVLDDATNSALGTTTILAPNGDRHIDGGISDVQAIEIDNMAALQHLQDVVESVNGNMFVDRSGAFVFHNRHRPFNQPYNAVLTSFGDNAGELPYQDAQTAFDDSLIINQVRITRLDGTEQTASDSASRTKYGLRVMERSSQLMTTDAEALYAAQYLVGRYKEISDPLTDAPMLRFTRLELVDKDSDTLWPTLLTLDLAYRIGIIRRPSVGNLISQESIIVGIGHRYSQDWRVVLSVYPADTRGFWVLEDTTYSALDNTTRLAY